MKVIGEKSKLTTLFFIIQVFIALFFTIATFSTNHIIIGIIFCALLIFYCIVLYLNILLPKNIIVYDIAHGNIILYKQKKQILINIYKIQLFSVGWGSGVYECIIIKTNDNIKYKVFGLKKPYDCLKKLDSLLISYNKMIRR